MAYSHEGSTQKIENVLDQFKPTWKPAKRRRFHDWLGSAYPGEKDQMSERRLYEVAQEFAHSDRDQWND